MPKVKVVKRYSDVCLKKIMEKDMVFEVDEKRAEHLVKEGVAVLIPEKAEDTTEKATKNDKRKEE